MKIYALTFVLLLLLTGFLVLQTSRSQTFAEESHLSEQVARETQMRQNNQAFTAKFLVFTNGTQRIFSTKKFFYQWPDAYLTPDAPTKVHVNRAGVTWDEFFQSIPMQLNDTCLVLSEKQQFCAENENAIKFYLNGVKEPDLLHKEIHDGDLVLISYGSENQIELNAQLKAVNALR